MALLINLAMAIWYIAGMSSKMGDSLSWRIVVDLVWMFRVSWILGDGVLLGVVVIARRLAVYYRRVGRLICLVSD
jgi:hypothetical protein